MLITQTFKGMENKGKGVFTILSIQTVHILSEFNYREVKWKWNTEHYELKTHENLVK